ncbi:methylornithine synthase PylB [Desulforhopalus singaporensis]|uniref:Pyrrolysine biosynthesis protein PylB n=1 Tax=Desulforhopalus singaporensis TaxID=91360 RepID=A0A1H0TBA2_9BACT|nr:methylornithine synthase PylB [Desulforhopalus singaporensis]SDP51284.1 pyrrolysine biosynthesis protein PylB [Desulforhopalus singaporensis]
MNTDRFSLPAILCKPVEGTPLVRDEIKYLLGLEKKSEVELLQRVARLVRTKHFGQKVFLYGFVYFSTYCKNNCTFCHYRRDNREVARYRKNESEVVEAARNLRDSGVHLIDLTMGEDPEMFHPDFGLKRLVRLTGKIRSETGLPVMLSPGAAPEAAISEFAKAGAEWYACYQETHTESLFDKLRIGQSYKERYATKVEAKSNGMLIEEGILTGVGETLDDIADSILAMKEMKADQVRAMTFVPQKGAPLESYGAVTSNRELNVISVMRLVLPDTLIPASLDIDGLNGLQKRLLAGANVVTSIVPPGRGLAGVANSSLDIEESRRTVDSIKNVLQFIGMETATAEEYRHWVEDRMQGEGNPMQMGGASVNCRYWS